MILYFDASAWVKAYNQEVGTHKVGDLLKSEKELFSSRVSYAEVLFALRRIREQGDFSEQEFFRQLDRFQVDWKTFYVVDFLDPVSRILKDRVLKHSLRALDAIHLASALWVKDFFDLNPTFVCADHKLLEAATQEQLTILNPEETD